VPETVTIRPTMVETGGHRSDRSEPGRVGATRCQKQAGYAAHVVNSKFVIAQPPRGAAQNPPRRTLC
jgi:hypothetical protein